MRILAPLSRFWSALPPPAPPARRAAPRARDPGRRAGPRRAGPVERFRLKRGVDINAECWTRACRSSAALCGRRSAPASTPAATPARPTRRALGDRPALRHLLRLRPRRGGPRRQARRRCCPTARRLARACCSTSPSRSAIASMSATACRSISSTCRTATRAATTRRSTTRHPLRLPLLTPADVASCYGAYGASSSIRHPREGGDPVHRATQVRGSHPHTMRLSKCHGGEVTWVPASAGMTTFVGRGSPKASAASSARKARPARHAKGMPMGVPAGHPLAHAQFLPDTPALRVSAR